MDTSHNVQVNNTKLPIGFFCESCGFFLDENKLKGLRIPVNLRIKFAKKRMFQLSRAEKEILL